MKIGLVSPYNMFRPGGVQVCIEALADELRKRNHSVKIIAPQSKQAYSDNPNLLLVGQSTSLSVFSTTADVGISLDNNSIDAMFECENFDVLHFHEPWIPILAMQLLGRSDCANVATFHAKLPDSPLSKSIEKITTPYTKSVFKNLHAISAVSEPAADFVGSLTNNEIKIIPNGIDLKFYSFSKAKKMSEYDDGLKNILFVGRLEKRKGAQYLLRAFRVLQEEHPNTRLLIAGDGTKRKSLEQYVKKHGLKNVEFLGFVSEKEKRDLLKTADLFVSPALYGESFGIVLLEAMAMGTPLIAGNNPGYSSVMKDRGRISLVDPTNKLSLTHKMELMLEDNDMRQLWKKWAKQYVSQFDYPKIVDQYESLYKQAISTLKQERKR